MNWTAVYQKVPQGYVGWVEELPGANTQGTSLPEVKENLKEAIALILEANRKLRGRRRVRLTFFVNRLRREAPGSGSTSGVGGLSFGEGRWEAFHLLESGESKDQCGAAPYRGFSSLTQKDLPGSGDRASGGQVTGNSSFRALVEGFRDEGITGLRCSKPKVLFMT